MVDPTDEAKAREVEQALAGAHIVHWYYDTKTYPPGHIEHSMSLAPHCGTKMTYGQGTTNQANVTCPTCLILGVRRAYP